MRKLASLVVLLCVLPGLAHAADKLELFGGYQYTHLDPSFNLNGFNGSATVNAIGWLGITGDFSGVYHSGQHFYTYTVGPELRANLPLIKPFVHALIGGGRSSGGGVSDNGFVAMAGGGLDVGGGPIAFRLVQFDWMETRFNGFSNSKNARASAGIVIRF